MQARSTAAALLLLIGPLGATAPAHAANGLTLFGGNAAGLTATEGGGAAGRAGLVLDSLRIAGDGFGALHGAFALLATPADGGAFGGEMQLEMSAGPASAQARAASAPIGCGPAGAYHVAVDTDFGAIPGHHRGYQVTGLAGIEMGVACAGPDDWVAALTATGDLVVIGDSNGPRGSGTMGGRLRVGVSDFLLLDAAYRAASSIGYREALVRLRARVADGWFTGAEWRVSDRTFLGPTEGSPPVGDRESSVTAFAALDW